MQSSGSSFNAVEELEAAIGALHLRVLEEVTAYSMGGQGVSISFEQSAPQLIALSRTSWTPSGNSSLNDIAWTQLLVSLKVVQQLNARSPLGASVGNIANAVFASVLGSRGNLADIETRAASMIRNSRIKSTAGLYDAINGQLSAGRGQFNAVAKGEERVVSELGAEARSLNSRAMAVQNHNSVLAQRAEVARRDRAARLIQGGCDALLAQAKAAS